MSQSEYAAVVGVSQPAISAYEHGRREPTLPTLRKLVRGAVLRGGSAYQPQSSHWYFPQAYRLDEHGKFLLMAPAKDRSAGIGFRCAADR